MANEDTSFRPRIMLSVQRALLGSITCNLRGVAAEWNDKEIRIICYFHGPLSEDDREEMSCVHTEVVADFVDIAQVHCDLERLDMPAKLFGPEKAISLEKPIGNRAWVFLRKE
jgi:hypothetical protein